VNRRSTVRIIGIADLPDMKSDFIEEGLVDIGGGVGLGELAFTSVPAVVINAFGKAIGH
jgi:CO/xanthine dehydrogenase Mo-binding subunit